jgi:hypothetical protein
MGSTGYVGETDGVAKSWSQEKEKCIAFWLLEHLY